VLDHLDPDDKLFTSWLYHNACRDTRDNRLVEDSSTTSRSWDHTFIANNNPTTYAMQLENVVLVASFIKIDNDQKPPQHLGGHQRVHDAQHGVPSSTE
jgi:TFIIF-interacting CTD phosphatase-like protein